MIAKKELADILASIDELAQRGQITRSRAFASWFAINFFSVDEDEALEGAAADGGNDQGIDLVFLMTPRNALSFCKRTAPKIPTKKHPKANGMQLSHPRLSLKTQKRS